MKKSDLMKEVLIKEYFLHLLLNSGAEIVIELSHEDKAGDIANDISYLKSMSERRYIDLSKYGHTAYFRQNNIPINYSIFVEDIVGIALFPQKEKKAA